MSRGKEAPKKLNSEKIHQILFEKIKQEQEKIKNPKKIDSEKLKYSLSKWNVISLFSGCGGLDAGLLLAGLSIKIGKEQAITKFNESKESFHNALKENGLFQIIYAIDNNKEAIETYRKNIGEETFSDISDIRQVSFPNCDLIIGGFPCPGFSEGGPRLIDDERNFLYLHFVRALIESKPKFFVAENVKGLLTLGKGIVFDQMKQDFENCGYNLTFKLVNAVDYGVPQFRERVFIIGTRIDIEFNYKFEKPTYGPNSSQPYMTIRDAIGDLETNPGPFFTGGFSSMFLSRNRKKNWDEPSFTIQASGRQTQLHPSGPAMIKKEKDKWILPGNENKHRRFSVKEISRLQTFPDWYEISHGNNQKSQENTKLDKIYKQIGNAVPILLSLSIFIPIASFVLNEKTKSLLGKKRKIDSDIII